MRLTGAQMLIETLANEGVELVFGYPGGAVMPVYDALARSQRGVKHVLVRHEQGATHAAQGYARACGGVGVCLATSGPGATNFITGLQDALMDSTPLVCITGQVSAGLLGSEAFQEADVVGLSLAATKWSYQIVDPAEVPGVIAHAFHVARSGRPGPVLIDITRDAQTALHELPGDGGRRGWSAPGRTGAGEDHQDLSGIEDAARLINRAERPFLMVGNGVLLSGAREQTMRLAEQSGMPVAATLLGLSAFPVDHPQYVGMLGMHGNYGPNVLTNSADVIVAVGMRFDDRVTGRLDGYATAAKVIHIEIDPSEIDRHVEADVALVADAKVALEALLPHVEGRVHRDWLARFRERDSEEREQVITPELEPGEGSIRMGEVIDRISRHTGGDAVIVSDVGQHQMHAARYYAFSGGPGQGSSSHITSGGLGTMGFALPAAIGAKLGAPSRQVIAIAGDGAFQMTVQELGTLMQSQAAVKIVILNNSYLGMVRQWQELFFDGCYSEVAMHNPDFVTLASAYGILGWRVSERARLDEGIAALLAARGPALLEVRVGATDNVFPMIPAGASVDEMILA